MNCNFWKLFCLMHCFERSMENLKSMLILGLFGVRDCLNGVLALKQFCSTTKQSGKNISESTKKTKKIGAGSKTIFEVLLQCTIFGFMNWIAMFLFKTIINGYCFNYLRTFSSPEESESISYWLNFLNFCFIISWTCPLYFINHFLNLSWYQEIADISSANAGIKKTYFSMSHSLSDQITSITVQLFFLLQVNVIYLLPVPSAVKNILSIVQMALYYSLYAFEYKWVHKGWPLHKRLSFIESKWPYFIGFGFPMAILTFYVGTYSFIESSCLSSVLFPFYVIGSSITFDNKLKDFNSPIRVFRIVTWISDFLICRVCKWMYR